MEKTKKSEYSESYVTVSYIPDIVIPIHTPLLPPPESNCRICTCICELLTCLFGM
jgi:hypothetical protein